MKLKFIGAAGNVTGSKTLLELGKEKYLIDYGLYQGSSLEREKNWVRFHDASKVTALFLTHAHIDHSGLLPRLWRDGFRGKIFCTKDTFKLCQILLMDSARIHEEDAAYANKKNFSRHKPALPLTTQKEAEEVLSLFVTCEFEKEIEISKHLTATFFWAGHIMGASFIRFFCDNLEGVMKTITFTGDVGHKRNVLLNFPHKMCQTDILILESTYGDRLHPRVPTKDILGVYLNTILSRSGVAVIPSFSVGRTQDVLYLIKLLMDEKKVPRVPIFLDSPLSKKANQIFNECFKKGCVQEDIVEKGDIYPAGLKEIDSVIKSKQLMSSKGPMIIISASGMIDGGRVVHHVKKRVTDEKNGIILVGYQPEGTKGRLLLDGIDMLRLHKEELPVKADIFYVDALSAHGDFLDIVEWLKESQISPDLVILNHGEKQSSKHLKTVIESQLEFTTTIASHGEEFFLDAIYHK